MRETGAMAPRSLGRELKVISAALLIGLALAWLDSSQHEVQGSVLLLLIAGFCLGLVQWAPIVFVGVSLATGIIGAGLIGLPGEPFAGRLLAIIPATIGVGAGQIAAGMLHRAVPSVRLAAPFGIACLVACGGYSIGLHLIQHPLELFLALVWTSVSLVGWMLLLPGLIKFVAARDRTLSLGLASAAVSRSAAMILVACTAHALLLLSVTLLLLIPIGSMGVLALLAVGFGASIAPTIVLYILASRAAMHTTHQELSTSQRMSNA